MLDAIPTYTPLLSLRPNGDVAPLFCVHPVSGYALAFHYLAEALGPRIPVWGLQARGLQHGDAPHGSLEAMAGAYVDAIRTVQPRGPYRLLGWSIGGFIAHAMACQLEAQGDVVHLLGLLDTPAVPGNPDGADVPLPPADGLASMDARAAQVFRAAAIARGLLPADAPDAWGTGMLEQMRLAPGRMRDFTPRRCQAQVLLFRATEEPCDGDGEAMFGWETLTNGSVERVPIACRHAELGDRIHATQIAVALGARLV
jgi:phthiocerol/phenolphthiocerol synthesis type-I polyketide synthase E